MPGLGPADIQRLKEAGLYYHEFSGFHTLEAVAYTAKKNLLIIKGMTEAKIDKIVEAVAKMIQNGFKTATEILKTRENLFYISTGSSV